MLEVNNLSVAYHSLLAVKNISFTVSPGEVVALIGPNGAGKSTLMRAISGVLKKQAGEIRYAGTDLTTLSPATRARILAVVPQARHFGGAFTVRQTVMMGRTAHMNWLGHPGEEDHRMVQLALEKTRSDYLTDRKIAELSGGEQQRVLLARALAQNSPLLILDEPTTHLDLQHQSMILSLVREQAATQGLAVLMALHDLNLVSSIADRVALMVSGEFQKMGKPNEVLTAEDIGKAYQTGIQVISHPTYGTPIILLDNEGNLPN